MLKTLTPPNIQLHCDQIVQIIMSEHKTVLKNAFLLSFSGAESAELLLLLQGLLSCSVPS